MADLQWTGKTTARVPSHVITFSSLRMFIDKTTEDLRALLKLVKHSKRYMPLDPNPYIAFDVEISVALDVLGIDREDIPELLPPIIKKPAKIEVAILPKEIGVTNQLELYYKRFDAIQNLLTFIDDYDVLVEIVVESFKSAKIIFPQELLNTLNPLYQNLTKDQRTKLIHILMTNEPITLNPYWNDNYFVIGNYHFKLNVSSKTEVIDFAVQCLQSFILPRVNSHYTDLIKGSAKTIPVVEGFCTPLTSTTKSLLGQLAKFVDFNTTELPQGKTYIFYEPFESTQYMHENILNTIKKIGSYSFIFYFSQKAISKDMDVFTHPSGLYIGYKTTNNIQNFIAFWSKTPLNDIVEVVISKSTGVTEAKKEIYIDDYPVRNDIISLLLEQDRTEKVLLSELTSKYDFNENIEAASLLKSKVHNELETLTKIQGTKKKGTSDVVKIKTKFHIRDERRDLLALTQTEATTKKSTKKVEVLQETTSSTHEEQETTSSTHEEPLVEELLESPIESTKNVVTSDSNEESISENASQSESSDDEETVTFYQSEQEE